MIHVTSHLFFVFLTYPFQGFETVGDDLKIQIITKIAILNEIIPHCVQYLASSKSNIIHIIEFFIIIFSYA